MASLQMILEDFLEKISFKISLNKDERENSASSLAGMKSLKNLTKIQEFILDLIRELSKHHLIKSLENQNLYWLKE